MKRALCFALCLIGQTALADVMFEDRSAGLPEHVYTGGWTHFVGGGVAVFDCDADGLPDLFAAGGDTPAKLMRNKGGFVFETADVPPLTGVTGAYPLDINADGFMDLYVLRVGPDVVLRGSGGCTFSDATQAWGIPTDDGWSTAFSAWWPDGAARPTMAVGYYVDRADPDGPFEACDDNRLLTPTQGGYARDILSPGYCALSILAARDASGTLRLRLSNDRHYYVKGGKEQLWDPKSRRFLEEQDGWPDVSLWGMGIASRDLTGDGRDEVMLTSMGDQLLQIAQASGAYQAAPFSIGTYAQRPHVGGDGRPSTGWHAEFGDIDNDGLADLFIAKGNVDQMPGMATRDPNNLLQQQEDGTFAEVSAKAGVATMARSRGAALADFDGDGRLDLVVVNRRARMELYRNITADTGNWAQISLMQSGSNPDAIGAQVMLGTSTHQQSAQKLVGGGHAGGQALPLHFGLGGAAQAGVTVRWPDGTLSGHVIPSGTVSNLRKPD